VIDGDHLEVGLYCFAEVLFPFGVGLIDFLPGRGEEDEGRVAVAGAGMFDEAGLRETDEAGIAEGIGDPAVRECWLERGGVPRNDSMERCSMRWV